MSKSAFSESDLTPRKLMTNEQLLIKEIKDLIYFAENDVINYSVLEHARKLVFSIENPPLPQDRNAYDHLDKL